MKKSLIKTLLLIVLLLLAIVLGKALGNVCEGVSYLSWLGMSADFGLAPATLDLAVFNVTFGAKFSLNVAQAILLLIAILCYIKIRVKD